MELIFDCIKGNEFHFKNCCWQDAELQFYAIKMKLLTLMAKEDDCPLMFNNNFLAEY